MKTALRVLGAATVGGAAAAGYAIASGLAFNALSRGLEIGAVPLMLAAFVFVGLLAGTVAGLLCQERPYVAAVLAAFLVFVFATGVNDLKEQLTPALTRDERRGTEGRLKSKKAPTPNHHASWQKSQSRARLKAGAPTAIE